MSKIVQGAKEALAVAKGEAPAAAIWHNGHRYVPEAEIVRLREERDRLRDALTRLASTEAFDIATAEIPVELSMRIDFARAALRGDTPG